MSGMTLIETLLVIAITTVITVSAGFGLAVMQSQFQLRSSGDEIRSQLQYGRELAIANGNYIEYTIRNEGNSVILLGGGAEIARYQVPERISFSPAAFSWGFAPVTGLLTGCSLPCTLGLTLRGNSEIIIVRSNGIVD